MGDDGVDDAGQPDAVGRLTDVTDASGVDFINESLFGIAGGVAVLDFDGDRDLDLFFTSEQGASLLMRNEGDWRFDDATNEAGLSGTTGALGAVALDLEGDGDEDLVVGAMQGARIFRNAGGTFGPAEAPPGLAQPERRCPAIAPGDIDRDGLVDIYLGCWSNERGRPNALLLQQPDGSFSDVAEQWSLGGAGATLAVALSDHDADGDLDLLEINDFGMMFAGNELYDNDGRGGFLPAGAEVGFDHEIFGMGVAALDFDGDLDLDYYVTNAFYDLLLRNDDGHFTDVARQVGAGVYGFEDAEQIFYQWSDISGPNADRAREYREGYTDPSSRLLGLTSFAPIAVDLDQDGYEDLYIVNGFVGFIPLMPEGQRQPNVLLLARGDGTFEEAPWALGGDDRGDGRGGAHADLDGDGDQDLIVVNNGFKTPLSGGAVLYRNDMASGASIRVRARMADGLRDAFGASVTAWIGDRGQVREIGCWGFASCSERVAHFGLGDAPFVDRVVLRFPSGSTVTIENVPAGAALEVSAPY